MLKKNSSKKCYLKIDVFIDALNLDSASEGSLSQGDPHL